MSLSISQSGGDCLLLHLLHLLKEEGLYGSQETQFTASADLIPAQNWLYDSYCCSTEREMRQNVLFTPSQGKIVTRVHYYVQNFQKFLIFLLLNLMANFCWIFLVRRSGFGHIWSPEKSKVALARSLALLWSKTSKSHISEWSYFSSRISPIWCKDMSLWPKMLKWSGCPVSMHGWWNWRQERNLNSWQQEMWLVDINCPASR